MYGQRVAAALVILFECCTNGAFGVSAEVERSIARAHKQAQARLGQKERDINRLIAQTEKFLKIHSISETCNKILHAPVWRKGELFVFIFDDKGTCYAFGSQRERIWTDFFGKRDVMQLPLIERLLNAKEGTAIAFDINNATMHAYVKKATKDERTFLIGSGFYPSEQDFILVDLVSKAKDWMKLAGVDRTLSIANNPFGRLRMGSSYVFVADSEGFMLAHGKSHARRGQRVYEGSQAITPPLYKKQLAEILEFAKSDQQSRWFTHHFSNTTDYVYIEKYVDEKTKKLYLVGAVGHPEVNEKNIYQFVQDAIAFLKKGPRDAALEEFTVNRMQKFIQGAAAISVYALDGTCLANGERPEFVGYNVAHMNDAVTGKWRPIKQLMDEVKRNGSAWQTTYEKNASKATYAELVDLPDEQVVVTSGFWLNSRRSETQAMVESAVRAFEFYGVSRALNHLVDGDVEFLRGDLYPSVATPQGILLAAGHYKKFDIWGQGSPFFAEERGVIQKVLKKARNGDGWMKVKCLNSIQDIYVKTYEHALPGGQKEQFVVWAGYWS